MVPGKTTRESLIVFALVDSGMGHKSPALAVKEHLEMGAPGEFDVRIVDMLDELGLRGLDRFVKRSWSEVFLRYPWLIDGIYWVGHTFSGVIVPGLALLLRSRLRLLERYCTRLHPDLLVTTHFLSTNSLAILRSRRRIETKVIGMVVDPFETYRVAGHPGLDGLVTFSRRSQAAYRRHLPSVDVTRFGFPLSARFRGRITSRAQARRKLGIRDGRFVLLMTGGAEGVGNFQLFFQKLMQASLDLHVIVVCGRNAVLRRELREWAQPHLESSGTECTILGFVDNMQDLIASCDVFLGQGGANLTMEALAIGRPTILTLYTPNIRGTVDYVVRGGFGWHCTRAERFVPLVRKLLGEPELVREAERKIADAGISSGTPELAQYLAGLVSRAPKPRLKLGHVGDSGRRAAVLGKRR